MAGFSTDFLTPDRALSEREGSGRPSSPLQHATTSGNDEEGDSEAEVEEEAWEELRDSEEEDDAPPGEPLNSSDPAGARAGQVLRKGSAAATSSKNRGSTATRKPSTMRSRRSVKSDSMDVD